MRQRDFYAALEGLRSHLDQRFDHIDLRFDAMNHRLDQIINDIAGMKVDHATHSHGEDE